MGSKRNIRERKLHSFGHIFRMEDSRLVKEVVFGEMKGKAKGRSPKTKWLDDVRECCKDEIYILKKKAQGAFSQRHMENDIFECALDTNG